MRHLISSLPPQLLSLVVCLLVAHAGIAADKAEKPATTTNTVTGKWTYTLEVSLDTALDFVAELKQDGEKVTGFVLNRAAFRKQFPISFSETCEISILTKN